MDLYRGLYSRGIIVFLHHSSLRQSLTDEKNSASCQTRYAPGGAKLKYFCRIYSPDKDVVWATYPVGLLQ